jgi:hypothetical protein
MIAVVEARQGPRYEGGCLWPGCSAAWEQVDHIESRADHPELVDEPDNWQGLCAYHNSAKGRGGMPARARGGGQSRAWLS